MTDTATLRLVFEPPSKDEPGYLKRVKRALQLQKDFKADPPDPEVVDSMVAFLLPYIKEPADRQIATDFLWEASEAQFNDLMEAMKGNPTPQPQKNGSE